MKRKLLKILALTTVSTLPALSYAAKNDYINIVTSGPSSNATWGVSDGTTCEYSKEKDEDGNSVARISDKSMPCIFKMSTAFDARDSEVNIFLEYKKDKNPYSGNSNHRVVVTDINTYNAYGTVYRGGILFLELPVDNSLEENKRSIWLNTDFRSSYMGYGRMAYDATAQ